MKTKQDLQATCASCQYENWKKTTHLQCKGCNGQNWKLRQKKVWATKPQPELEAFLRGKLEQELAQLKVQNANQNR